MNRTRLLKRFTDIIYIQMDTYMLTKYKTVVWTNQCVMDVIKLK